MTDTATRVSKIISEHLGVDAEKITPEAMLCDDLGADSLDTVELVMACEQEFNIEITDEEAEKTMPEGRVMDLVSLVDTKRAAA